MTKITPSLIPFKGRIFYKEWHKQTLCRKEFTTDLITSLLLASESNLSMTSYPSKKPICLDFHCEGTFSVHYWQLHVFVTPLREVTLNTRNRKIEK